MLITVSEKKLNKKNVKVKKLAVLFSSSRIVSPVESLSAGAGKVTSPYETGWIKISRQVIGWLA